jgi:hypothetical protein
MRKKKKKKERKREESKQWSNKERDVSEKSKMRLAMEAQVSYR